MSLGSSEHNSDSTSGRMHIISRLPESSMQETAQDLEGPQGDLMYVKLTPSSSLEKSTS